MWKKLFSGGGIIVMGLGLQGWAPSNTSNSSVQFSPQPRIEAINSENRKSFLRQPGVIEGILQKIRFKYFSPKLSPRSLAEIKAMLYHEGDHLSKAVINSVVRSIECASVYSELQNNILTIIDYSLPSSEKRLWVFDLVDKKLLFHTYVSHGLKSGENFTEYFSNKYNSKASSLGVYKTEEAYYGREGLSLRLDGLDRGLNDNASGRAVVMHGGWYVNESFIKKYGRAGRSWGCPALPEEESDQIIKTIKDHALFVVYYPTDQWLTKSKFLNCTDPTLAGTTGSSSQNLTPPLIDNSPRDPILFVDVFRNHRMNETKPVVAMPAQNYVTIFQHAPVLNRMLRRQINGTEYIALSDHELWSILQNPDPFVKTSSINFVTAEIKMVRGYYKTELKVIDLGSIKDILGDAQKGFTVEFESNHSFPLTPTHEFIRWVGL